MEPEELRNAEEMRGLFIQAELRRIELRLAREHAQQPVQSSKRRSNEPANGENKKSKKA